MNETKIKNRLRKRTWFQIGEIFFLIYIKNKKISKYLAKVKIWKLFTIGHKIGVFRSHNERTQRYLVEFLNLNIHLASENFKIDCILLFFINELLKISRVNLQLLYILRVRRDGFYGRFQQIRHVDRVQVPIAFLWTHRAITRSLFGDVER